MQLLASSETFQTTADSARHGTFSQVAEMAGDACRIVGSKRVQPTEMPSSFMSLRHQSSSPEVTIATSIGAAVGVWIVRHKEGKDGRKPAGKWWAPMDKASGSRVHASQPAHVHRCSECIGASSSLRHVNSWSTKWQSLCW